jgi:NAD(P)-dependent dehydrogenase (short-subunit alcohol dehydrogenase family)
VDDVSEVEPVAARTPTWSSRHDVSTPSIPRSSATAHHGGALRGACPRKPIGRLATMAELVDASRFLRESRAINGINLSVDGGWLCLYAAECLA